MGADALVEVLELVACPVEELDEVIVAEVVVVALVTGPVVTVAAEVVVEVEI